jgi:hypothetical protein
MMRAIRVTALRMRTIRVVLCVVAVMTTFGELQIDAQRVRSRAARAGAATSRPAAAATRRAAPARRVRPTARATRAAVARVARGIRARSPGMAAAGGRIRRPGVTVIGRYRESRNVRPAFARALRRTHPGQAYDGYYVRFARRIGANYFNVSQQRWERMSPRERWRANRRFLDAAIQRGDRIRLSSRLRRTQNGFSYSKEVAYLERRGYRIDPRGRWMLPTRPVPRIAEPVPRIGIRRAVVSR